MTSGNKTGVGRPPQTDGSGKQIAKTHVTLLLPVNLKEFLLRQPKMNMSALFTRVVTSLYVGAICPKCYSDKEIHQTHVGTYCGNCSNDYRTFFFVWNDCPNCNLQYNHGNMSHNIADKIGCQTCLKEVKE